MHEVLEQLYREMKPLCGQLMGVGQGIAGFAAMWYIGSRVWRHIANAEPIDFYPLLRPFVIGFCIMAFPLVLALINGVMQPVVGATSAMVEHSDRSVQVLLEKQQEAIKKTSAWQMYVGEYGDGDRAEWYKYTHGDDAADEGILDGIGNDIKFAMDKASYNFRNSVREWMSEILQVLFQAAALCVNTLRTFQLVVLSILGPLIFGISVFDGFQHTLTVWLARYINIFLWLPVANIFGGIIGKIQENMLKIDLSQIAEQGDTYFSRTGMAYQVFLIIGIVGYFCVPSVANYIVHASGGSALVQKVNRMLSQSSRSMVQAAGVSMSGDGLGDSYSRISQSMSERGQSGAYFKERGADEGNYMNKKLKGNE
ncbi:conjugative transposon protein TraJ [Sphingobacterium cellulitidis]|uniref:Conjugative transposon protein TraJ n=2 Tax=Sphingobacterium cellulitidis TaxID=1768011 RepID=A0A8H9G0B7_9SPHI|nr:conjugative transposon protein TraJ [Sphingobacterium soli]